MDGMDFTNLPYGYRSYGGAATKRSVLINNEPYIVKLAEPTGVNHPLADTIDHSPEAEYIGCHIAASMGLPVQETILGTYDGQRAVACKDFRANTEDLHDFNWCMEHVYDNAIVQKVSVLPYGMLDKTLKESGPIQGIQKEARDRYFDTMILDALLGNFDRHAGNFGFLAEAGSKTIRLAPIYDCGSGLFKRLSDFGMLQILNDTDALKQRGFQIPLMALTKEIPDGLLDITNTNRRFKINKYGYAEFIQSEIDPACTRALVRMMPRIDLNKINKIIDETPGLSPVRKEFYKTVIAKRKEMILDKSLEILAKRHFLTPDRSNIDLGFDR